MKTNLNEIASEVYEANKKKGFYQEFEDLKDAVSKVSESYIPIVDRMFFAQRLALITSETSETLESNRKNNTFSPPTAEKREWKKHLLDDKISTDSFNISFENYVKDTEEDEIADQFIRLLDLVGHKKIDIDFHIQAKLKYNSLRPFKHGKKY